MSSIIYIIVVSRRMSESQYSDPRDAYTLSADNSKGQAMPLINADVCGFLVRPTIDILSKSLSLRSDLVVPGHIWPHALYQSFPAPLSDRGPARGEEKNSTTYKSYRKC